MEEQLLAAKRTSPAHRSHQKPVCSTFVHTGRATARFWFAYFEYCRRRLSSGWCQRLRARRRKHLRRKVALAAGARNHVFVEAQLGRYLWIHARSTIGVSVKVCFDTTYSGGCYAVHLPSWNEPSSLLCCQTDGPSLSLLLSCRDWVFGFEPVKTGSKFIQLS